jgi:hypothetical protein
MNAVLAKPIHAIWFIRVSAVDLNQSLAAALFAGLPSWLRDHPSLPRPIEDCCIAQSKNFQKLQRAAPSPISANGPQNAG